MFLVMVYWGRFIVHQNALSHVRLREQTLLTTTPLRNLLPARLYSNPAGDMKSRCSGDSWPVPPAVSLAL